jgi:multidrug efflux system membrane fusion protein
MNSSMKSLARPRVVLLALVVLIVVALAWSRSHQGAQAATDKSATTPAIAVDAATVARHDVPGYLEGLGTAQAFYTVKVTARVDGQLDHVDFTEGQTLKKGQVLAQIDPRPFQAALDQAKAKKTQDAANLVNARLDLQRYSTLAKQSYATQQQLDTQDALVNQLIAQIAADVAASDAAQVQLDYTKIRAPISGRAGFRLIDEGNMVAASQQTGIVVIAQIHPIAVIFTAPEDDVGRINAILASGEPKVTVKNTDDVTLATGKLTITDNQVDTTTGTLRLKAEFENKDNALWPGLAVTTGLTVGVDKDALLVPTASVQHGQKGLYVYVVDDQNRAAMRPVTVSQENTVNSVVTQGVKEGDRVVTVGQFLLQPGTPVAIDATANGS